MAKKRHLKLIRIDTAGASDWESDVLIQPIGHKERDILESRILSWNHHDPQNIRGLVAALVIVDDDGKRKYAEGDAAALEKRSPVVLERIVAAAMEISEIVIPFPTFAPPKSKAEEEGIELFLRILRANPSFHFSTMHQHLYQPGTPRRDHILPTIPSVPDEERKDALHRLLVEHPRPIYYKRWELIRDFVMSQLIVDAKGNEISVDEELKNRLLDSLQAALFAARRGTGIFASDEEFIIKLKRAYRKEAETDLRIPEETDAFSYLNLPPPPDSSEDAKEFDLEEWLVGWEKLTATEHERHLEVLVEQLDLHKRFEQLSPENQKMIRVLFEKNEDLRATADELNIPVGTLRKRRSRMRKKP